MTNKIPDILENEYMIKAISAEEVQGGWSAAAYKIACTDKSFFLKAYDRHRHTSQSWIKRIDSYMPVVLWLGENTGLRGKIPSSILTSDGKYKFENEDYIYLLFEFIDGDTICTNHLNQIQIRQLAEICAELHSIDVNDIPQSYILETFDVSFCDSIYDELKKDRTEYSIALREILSSYTELILIKIQELKELSDNLISGNPQFVLCHTDIHGWNLMQSSQLILIDWEGFSYAPPEADLFSFSRNFFFDYAWDDFMCRYRELRTEYSENPLSMRFYRLRRRLEDIGAFIEGLLYDNLSDEDTEESLKLLQHECSLLTDV